jgi:Flp pilus assembly protein TadB
MSQRPQTAATNPNVILPVLYAVILIVVGSLASGTVTAIVAVAGAVLLGLYFAFGRKARSRN